MINPLRSSETPDPTTRTRVNEEPEMSSQQLSSEDQAVIAELRRNWRDEMDATVAPIKKQVVAIMQRTSRAPGTLEHTALDAVPALSHQLLADSGFQAFAKSVLTRS